jgi:hypothetical protein
MASSVTVIVLARPGEPALLLLTACDEDKDRVKAMRGVNREGCRRVANDKGTLNVYTHRNGLRVLIMAACFGGCLAVKKQREPQGSSSSRSPCKLSREQHAQLGVGVPYYQTWEVVPVRPSQTAS